MFIVPIALDKYTICAPNDIDFMDHIEFYLFLEQEKRRAYQPLWYNFVLLTEGRAIQIRGPSNWRFRMPFIGDSNTLRDEDVIESDVRYRDPMAYQSQLHNGLMAWERLSPIDEYQEAEDHDPSYQDPQANLSHTERRRYDDTDDGKSWYEEEAFVHYHQGEPSHQPTNFTERKDEGEIYQDAQDPNEYDDSNAEEEDDQVVPTRIPRDYFHGM